jgi:fucose 4-O-acetylase-like acetyltransferase
MHKRDFSLDLLRFAGILLIIIAHTQPPSWLYQLRNFGTQLLIVTSALTYAFIYRNKLIEVKSFYKKRFSRLVFPAWIFLVGFFLFFFIAFHVSGKPFPFGFKIMIESFFFSGIAFLWILKVYITLAIITPIGLKLEGLIQNKIYYLLLLLLMYIIYEFLFSYTSPYIPEHYWPLLVSNMYMVIPHAILFLYGLKLAKLSRPQVYAISFLAFAVFLILAIQKYLVAGEFVPTQGYRFPPTMYYLSYAFFGLNMVYLCKDHLARVFNKELITWLSSNSLWIYFWHILILYGLDFWSGSPNGFQEIYGTISTFTFRITLVLLFSITMTYLQVEFAKRVLVNSEKAPLRWFSRMLLPA